LVHDFSFPTTDADAVANFFAEHSQLECAGWVMRPRYQQRLPEAAQRWEVFDEPLPVGAWRPSLDTNPRSAFDDVVELETIDFLLDREGSFGDRYAATLRRSEVICYAEEILARTKPDVVLFSDVPHSILSYCLYVLARRNSLTTLIVRRGPLPHHHTFSPNIEDDLHAFVGETPLLREVRPLPITIDYLERLRSRYEDAIPNYMRNQERRMTPHAVASRVLRRPARTWLSRESARSAATVLRRRRLRDDYERRALDRAALPSDFVCFYLHLQPERTTVPEGGQFAQQWVIAHTLAAGLPDGWGLVVREHPSTFRFGPRLVRTREFYDVVLGLPRTSFASLAVDPFWLLDHARAVATVTGTVALEAVARGTPAIVFGQASYAGCPGTLRVREPADAARHLQTIAAGLTIDDEAVRAFFADFDCSKRVFVAGGGHDGVSPTSEVLARTARYLERSE
jgi:hypothetical protein